MVHLQNGLSGPTAERVPRPFHTYFSEDIPPLFLNSLFALVNLFCGYCTPILKALLQTNLSFPGDSVVKNPPANTGDTGSMPGRGRVPGEGNGTPLQYSYLGNPMGKSIITHQVTSTLTSLVKHKGSWSRTAKPTVAAKVILPVGTQVLALALNMPQVNINRKECLWRQNNITKWNSSWTVILLTQMGIYMYIWAKKTSERISS